jgi:hypothetical protein
MPARRGGSSVLTRADLLTWAAGWLVISVVLVLSRFTSADPDSALYAQISARLAEGPPARWIAPEWWGLWESEGLFREHPAGVFFLPVLLGSAGIPVEQAAYIVGVGAGALCLVLAGVLVSRVTSIADGRAVLVLLQLMPVAFIFRLRSNHEYLMLAALLGLVLALDALKRHWGWGAAVALALVAALLVKGVFVIFLLLAAALWIVFDPTPGPPARGRQIAAMAAGAAAMLAVAAWYDAAYLRVTGESFWVPYWRRQMGQVEVLSLGDQALQLLVRVGFYIGVPLWHAAPWSVGLLAAAWRGWGSLRERLRRPWPASTRGVLAAALFVCASITLLSPSSRYAERYIFAGTYVLAMLGAVVTRHAWPSLTERLTAIDRRLPGLPALLWLVLVLMRLAAGPFLPRPS